MPNRKDQPQRKSADNTKSQPIKERIIEIISEIGKAFRWGFPFE